MFNLPINSKIAGNVVHHDGNHDDRGTPHEQYINKWNLASTINNKEKTNKFAKFASITFEVDNNINNLYIFDIINTKNLEVTELKVSCGPTITSKYKYNSEFQIWYTSTQLENSSSGKTRYQVDFYIKIYKSYNIFFIRLNVAKNNKVWNYDDDYAFTCVKMYSEEILIDSLTSGIQPIDTSETITEFKSTQSWDSISINPGSTYTISISNSNIKWDSYVGIAYSETLPDGLVTSVSLKSGGGMVHYKLTNVTSSAVTLPKGTILIYIKQ